MRIPARPDIELADREWLAAGNGGQELVFETERISRRSLDPEGFDARAGQAPVNTKEWI